MNFAVKDTSFIIFDKIKSIKSRITLIPRGQHCSCVFVLHCQLARVAAVDSGRRFMKAACSDC